MTPLPSPGVSDGWPEAQHEVAASPAPERVARPLPLPACHDRRYPRLAGAYVLACGDDGEPDRVLDLSTGRTTHLGKAASAYATGDGWLYAIGADAGLWTLPGASPVDGVRAQTPPIGPPARASNHIAYAVAGKIVSFEEGQSVRYEYPDAPAPWYAPAMAAGWLVWTRLADGELDLWGVAPGASDAAPFATGDGPQHHVVGDGHRLAWVDRGDVVVADLDARTRTRWPADAGFESAPTLWGDVACWEDRADGLQVRCSDGFSTPGRLPSGGGPLLLVRRDDGPVLWCARTWPLPRDGGEVTVGGWWGRGTVHVEVLEGGQWREVAAVDLLAGETRRIAVSGEGPVRARPDEPIPAGLR